MPGNPRPCGCGAAGCLETLVSRRGLLESFKATKGRVAGGSGGGPQIAGDGGGGSQIQAWKRLVQHVGEQGLEPWLAETLDTTAKVIAGGLNVMGLHRVIITGSLTEFPACVVEHLTQEIKRGAMWARFGEVSCQAAVRRRSSGLVAVGINRLVLPADDESGGPLPALSGSPGMRRTLSQIDG